MSSTASTQPSKGSGSGRGGGRGGGRGRGGGGRGGNRNRNTNTSKKNDETINSKQQNNQQKDHEGNNSKNSKRRRNNNRKKNDNNNTTTTSTTNNNKEEESSQLTEEEQRQMEEQIKIQIQLEKERKAKEEQEQQQQEYIQKVQDLELSITNKISILQTTIIDPTLIHISNRQLLTKEHLIQLRKDFQSSKKNLKTDLKKCTAFCKKIKSTPNWEHSTITSMIKDVETLNLTRYIEEIANAFMECKIKIADVMGVVEVCIALHKRYEEFMQLLLPAIQSAFIKKSSSSTSSSTNTGEDMKQRRIYLRLLLELYVNGVLSEAKPIMKILVEASGANSSNNNTDGNNKSDNNTDNYNVTDANIVITFAKGAGHEVIGIIPKSVGETIEFLQMEIAKGKSSDDNDTATSTNVIKNDDITTEETKETIDDINSTSAFVDDKQIVASSSLLAKAKRIIEDVNTALSERASSDEICDRFQRHLLGAFKCLCSSYTVTHKKLAKLEKRCEQDRLLAGALSEQREKGLNDARKLMDTLQKSVNVLAESLNEVIPVLEEEKDEELIEETVGVEIYKNQDEKDSNLGPFDDEETKAFYCDIPDFLTTIPPALLGYSTHEIERKQESNIQKYGSGFDGGNVDDNCGDFNEATSNDEFDDVENQELESVENNTDKDIENKEDTPHYKLMVLLEQELPECNRIDKVNELAEKFCTNHGTSKSSRKRMQQSLFSIPRSRLDLIPYYSRIAATFDRVFPDIADQLVVELEKQFHGLARWKKQQNLDNRIRNARYIGELTKFRVAPPIVALRGIKRCLEDFSGYNIDVACCLLEACGRFLYRTKHTSKMLTQLIDTMKRIRKAKHLDERHIALLNSAFYMVYPPQTTNKKEEKVLTPLEAYLKDLLLVRLGTNDITTAMASKQLLRFPWSDTNLDCGALITKYLLKACRKGRYKTISNVVSLISKLKKSKPEVMTRITDAVLEELQYSMEAPTMRDQQRSLIYAKLLGEMHCEGLISGSMIFEQLYNFVNFDHDIPAILREAKSSEEESSGNYIGKSLTITEAIQENEEMNEEELHAEKQESSATVAVSRYAKFDPRVPSSLDPETSVFRIKLICTLLDNSSHSLVSTSNISKLEKFMATFQRYLFIKKNLPADIEFSILDTFDIIDSRLKSMKKDKKKQVPSLRLKTWLECHNVVVTNEELSAITEEKLTRRLFAQAGLKIETSEHDTGDDFDEFVEQDLSVNSHDDDSIDNYSSDESSEDSVAANSVDDKSEEEIEVESEEEEDDEEADDEEESLENDNNMIDEAAFQEVHLRQLEDEAFERELRKLTLDALEKGKNAARTAATAKVSDTMPSASQFMGKKEFTHNNLTLGGETGMAFKLIKRGHRGRVESKDIIVPSDTSLAKAATKQDDEAAKERDMLKARVLRYEADSANQAFSDVYMDFARSNEGQNRHLTMEDIDRNFGSTKTFNRRGNSGRGSGRRLWQS